jgi:hypothetical protein
MRIALISCCAKKRDRPSMAKELYISPLFKMSYKYANKLDPDKIFILSAKHGLLETKDIIEPYDKTLNKMSKIEKEDWNRKVMAKLRESTDFEKDDFIFIAGKSYRQGLIGFLKKVQIPLEGLGIGRQLKWLKMKI